MWMLEQMLTYRVDAVLCVVLLALAAVSLTRWAQRKHNQRPPRVSWLLWGVLLTACMILPEWSGESERRRLQAMIEGIAPTYAMETALHGHDLITLDTPADDPHYLELIEQQRRWLQVNPSVSDIYTMRQAADGTVQLIVDSETDYNRNGLIDDDREARTQIGEAYDDPDDSILSALQGTASFNADIYTDRWGTWVSANVPIFKADGSVDAMLGVDYDASSWMISIAIHRAAVIAAVLFLAVFLVLASAVIVITRSELRRREALEQERTRLQEQLVIASRQAGMAEVATGVLHNVGNVLNSVNVSARMITDSLKTSRLTSLGKLSQLISSQKEQLGSFVTTDPRGKCLPDFIEQLHGKLREDQDTIQTEVDQLIAGIEHIKEVVRMQQSNATSSNIITLVDPVAIMEDAVKVNLISMERHHIELIRHYEPGLGDVPLDKHKVMQILINLLSNAKKATSGNDLDQRRITLRVCTAEHRSTLRFEVQDNGVGIAPQHAASMFQHGFTAFENGHGFGLHSGANAASEMKGQLTAHSNGLGQGATFTLTLPLTHAPLEAHS